MQKTCNKCSENFEITQEDLEFYKKISPKFNGEIFEIPTPALCPECRQQRRLTFRNERKLYKRKCDATGENIISIISPDKSYKVYSQEMWWSDKWSGLDYGDNFNFEKTFFEQFDKLVKNVPKSALINGYNENSYYCNHAGKQKNCYFSFDATDNENCYYTNDINHSKKCINSSSIKKSEIIIDSIIVINSYNCSNCVNIENCSNAYLSNNLINCNDCLGCCDLVNSEYCVLNKKVTKNEFNNILNKFLNDNDFKKDFNLKYKNLYFKTPKKNLNNINFGDSKGDYLFNVENIIDSYNCQNSKNLKYCSYIFDGEDCYDYDVWGSGVSRIYETHCAGGITNGASSILFSNIIWGGSNIYYSDNLENNSHNCFGCVGLKNNESYCILNKQYTKEEYNKLVPKIIEKMIQDCEWGEFFPANLSPFGYNETVAQEYFPLEKEEIINQKFNYSDYETPFPKVEKIIPAEKLPEDISKIPDDILNWAIECEVSKKPFRIISQELEFYRKHNLPIPRKHPDIRHQERMKLRNPRKLFDRKCDKCGVEMKSTYEENREEIVYCENCYNKEIG